MSILATQNINNLMDDFKASNRNAFPVSEDETAQVYFNGYDYAPPGLGTSFAATKANSRTTPAGSVTMNDGSGEAQYGPIGRMSNDQHSVLGGIAELIGEAQETGMKSIFSKDIGPTQMRNTFAISNALKSTNITEKVPGTDVTTSGVPVPQFTPTSPYGVSHTPVVTLSTDPAKQDTATVDGETVDSGAGIFGDLNGDGIADFGDFFKWVEGDLTANEEEGTVTGGGVPVVNMIPTGSSSQMGIQSLNLTVAENA